jgi:hypothetical protein
MDQQELGALLKERYGRVKFAPKGGVRIPCPTCDAAHAKEMKRYIYPNSYTCKCYICGEILEVKDVCGADVKFERGAEVEDVEHPQARELPFEHAFLIDQLAPDHPAVKFFKKDHLHEFHKYAEKYGVLYVPIDGGADIKYPNSTFRSSETILFPVKFKNELVGWQLRYMPGTWLGDKMISKGIKYLHVFQKGKYLYNYDEAKKSEHVILVEGIKKALKADNAVASWGKGLSDNQIELLCEWKHITVMLDGGAKTQTDAVLLRDQLESKGRSKGFNTTHIHPEERKVVNVDPREYGFPSPDEMTKEQFAQVVEDAWK